MDWWTAIPIATGVVIFIGGFVFGMSYASKAFQARQDHKVWGGRKREDLK